MSASRVRFRRFFDAHEGTTAYRELLTATEKASVEIAFVPRFRMVQRCFKFTNMGAALTKLLLSCYSDVCLRWSISLHRQMMQYTTDSQL